MANRFEKYVEERVSELASERRAKLKAAYDAEVAKIDRRRDAYIRTIETGVEALVQKVVTQAKKDGCRVDETDLAQTALSNYAKDLAVAAVGLKQTYEYSSHEYRWPEGTAVREAQDALNAFDELCAKEARRIVVYKKDLGMKPEAFEKMMAEVAKTINKEQ